MRDLNTLALHCDYTNTTDMVRDRFVMGIGDPLVKQKLQLMTADLSLDKAVTIARQNEQVKTQMREQLHHTAHVSEAREGDRYVRDRRRAEPQKSQTAKKNVIDMVTISILGTGSALLLARNAKTAIGEGILHLYVGHRSKRIMDQHTQLHRKSRLTVQQGRFWV